MSGLPPLAALCALALLILAVPELIRGFKTGVISGRGMDVKRSERPAFFWFFAAYYFLVVALAIGISVMLVLQSI